jgi:cytochrome c-type biogenesis protein CcmH/NrfF
MSRKIWTSKQYQDTLKLFKKFLVNKPLEEFTHYLTEISYFKKYEPRQILSQLNSIIKNVPKTKKEDIYITDDDIDKEFREPVRFTVRNGDDPKPIIDKIMKKYGKLSKDIIELINSKDIQITKRKRPNPYLN